MFDFHDKKFFISVHLCAAMALSSPIAAKAEVFGLNPTLGSAASYFFHPPISSSSNTITLFDTDITTGYVTEAYYGLSLSNSGYSYGTGSKSKALKVQAPYADAAVAIFYDDASNSITRKVDTATDSISGVIFDKNTSNPGAALIVMNNIPVNTVDVGFFNNKTTNSNGGGALMLYSGSSINEINADFLANASTSYGGALVNNGTIKKLKGSFIGNNAGQQGGAIRNNSGAKIDSITADFIGNNAVNEGGAIYNVNNATIGTITGDFIANNSTGTNGGAISNSGTIDKIKGQFINNTVTNSSGGGGAISNNKNGTIDTIEANFINNIALGRNGGGAILNHGTINTISGNFISNFSERLGTEGGDGAGIKNLNGGQIGKISGKFMGQTSVNYGGAISNYSTSQIDEIVGMFLNNTATEGGAIRNNGYIYSIEADFMNNSTHEREGGAIANNTKGVIDIISGHFENNYAETNGGAIWNTNKINTLTGSFINNIANNYGGAIYQEKGARLNIVADANSVEFTGNSDANGSANAIYQYTDGTVDNIISLNAADGKSIVINDAISGYTADLNSLYSNYIHINDIVTYNDIYGNYIDLPTGGIYEINNTVSNNNIVLFNGATLKLGANTQGSETYYGKLDLGEYFSFINIDAGGKLDTINDYINEQDLGFTTLHETLGLSIDVDATNLIADTFKLTSNPLYNGTIEINNINWINGVTQKTSLIQILDNQDTNDFIELSLGSSITPYIDVKNVTGSEDLTQNLIYWDDIYGGYTYDETTTLTVKLGTTTTTNDSIYVDEHVDNGTRVYNPILDNLALINQYTDTTRTFLFKTSTDVYTATANSGITFNGQLFVVGEANGNQRSTIDGNGYNLFEITDSNKTVVDIRDTKITGAANIATISSNNELYLVNTEISGNTGAIENNGLIALYNNNIINNNVFGNGTMAVNDKVSFGTTTDITQEILLASNGSEVNNEGNIIVGALANLGNIINNGTITTTPGTIFAGSTNYGTISGNGDTTIKTSLFNAGNIANTSITVDGGTVTTDINTFVTNSATDAINVIGGGKLHYISGTSTVRDITGTASSNVHFNTGSDIVLNNKITGVAINHDSGRLLFGSGNLSGASSVNLNGGAISVADGTTSNVFLGNVQLNQLTELGLDLNLDTLTTDTFTASVTNNGGMFHVSELNIQGTPKVNKMVRLHLGDMIGLGQENVTSDTFHLPEVLNPVHRLSGRISDGWLTYAPADNSYNSFNPAVMAAPIASQISGYLVMKNIQDTAFANMDLYRLGNNSGILGDRSSAGLRPYGTFETIPIKYGPNVTSEMYGSAVNSETPVRNLGREWYGALSLDAGYTFNRISYDNNVVRQNGMHIGATGMVYKNGFFAGLGLHVGAMSGYEDTQYGNEDFALLNAGVATKFGYNIKLIKEKLYLQPSGTAGYTIVIPFDYENAAGVHISAKPLQALSVEPGLKLITSIAGWRPYAEGSFVWNLFDETEFFADSYELPALKIEPYVKYGGGVEKTWGNHLATYGKVYGLSSGRRGMGFNAGIKYVF